MTYSASDPNRPDQAGLADTAGSTRWVVWRQDDNGNRFEVRRLDTRAAADALAATMEARGHKQMYWVAPADEGRPEPR